MDAIEPMEEAFESFRSVSTADSANSRSSKTSKYWSDLDKEKQGGKDYLYTENGISPRKGGPKEVRLNKVKLMKTGRYIEAAIARGLFYLVYCLVVFINDFLFPDDIIGDIDKMHSLRIDNMFHLQDLEKSMRAEFEVYGQLGDVYQPVNKDKNPKAKYPFVFVRFFEREPMLIAMEALQGKVICGRPMIISEAKAAFELATSIY